MISADLTAWLTLHVRLRGLRPGTVAQYQLALRDLTAWTTRAKACTTRSKRRTLTECDLIDWTLDRLARGAGPKTAKNNLAALLAVWETAADMGYVPPPDRRRFRLLRLGWRPPRPDSWTVPQVQAMLAACQRMPGRWQRGPYRGLRHGQYLEALIRLGLDTGLRRADLWAVRFADLAAGQWYQRMAKTAHHVACAASGATQAACEVLRRGEREPFIFGHLVRSVAIPCVHQNTHTRVWAVMLCQAGLPSGPREGLQKLRRTSATWAELIRPGAAREHLGHTSPSMAERHYVDRLAIGCQPVVPTSLLSTPITGESRTPLVPD